MPQASNRDEIRAALVSACQQFGRRHAVARRTFHVHAWRRVKLTHELLERRIDTESLDQGLARGVFMPTLDPAPVDVHQPKRDSFRRRRASEHVERRAGGTNARRPEVDTDDRPAR